MMKKILLAAAIVLSAATAFANDHIEHRIYSDRNFGQSYAKVVKMLGDRGYCVHDVDADGFRG